VAEQADHHPVIVNEMFMQSLRQRKYNPLQVAMQQMSSFGDQNELDLEELRIKQPYDYSKRNPDVFKQAKYLSNIIKNNLPGN